MNLEYQLYLCLMLATRLFYLRRDTPGTWRFAAILGVSQVVLILLMFEMSWSAAAVCTAALLFTVGAGLSERQWERRLPLDGLRLLSLLGLMLAPALSSLLGDSLVFSPFAQAVGSLLARLVTVFTANEGSSAVAVIPIVFGLLLLANEASIAMRWVLKVCGLVPVVKHEGNEPETDVHQFNAGRVIGILERWLMFLIIYVAGDWSALAFIIAAKGLMRLEKLKDPTFAEYMLVGTLLSVLFAIAVAGWLSL